MLRYVQGDTQPNPKFRVRRAGDPVDLTDATVKFIIRKRGGSVTNTGHQTCTLTDADSGKCTYDLQTNDLPDAATYDCDLQITYLNGEIETSPRKIVITARAQQD